MIIIIVTSYWVRILISFMPSCLFQWPDTPLLQPVAMMHARAGEDLEMMNGPKGYLSLLVSNVGVN